MSIARCRSAPPRICTERVAAQRIAASVIALAWMFASPSGLAAAGSLPVLLVAPEQGVVEVLVEGIVLERVPLRSARVWTWRDRAAGAAGVGDEEPGIDPAPVFVIAAPPPEATRRTLQVLVSSNTPESDSAALAAPLQTTSQTTEEEALPETYEAALEENRRLVVTTGPGAPGWLRRGVIVLLDRWAQLRGQPPRERLDRVVLAVDAEAARRLLPLLRPGTRLVFGTATGAELPASASSPRGETDT